MTQRKLLKNIASGLYGSFISRNNDVGGYWGMGKLCLLAQQHKTSKVELNLLEKQILPPSNEFTELLADYFLRLNKRLTDKGVPDGYITSATITVDFSPSLSITKPMPATTWGNLFKLTVILVDDKNKLHEIRGYGYCAAHDPRKESKSARAEH